MVLPGHLSGGFLTTAALLSVLNPSFSQGELTTLFVIGTLSGDFPDIDLFFFSLHSKFFNKTSAKDHRDYVTHTPIVWFFISAFISILGVLFSSAFLEYLGLTILCGSWSHLMFDSIEYGVMWLWPLNRTRYKIFKKTPKDTVTAKPGSMLSYIQFIKGAYLHTWTFWAELIVTVAAICTAFFVFEF